MIITPRWTYHNLGEKIKHVNVNNNNNNNNGNQLRIENFHI